MKKTLLLFSILFAAPAIFGCTKLDKPSDYDIRSAVEISLGTYTLSDIHKVRYVKKTEDRYTIRVISAVKDPVNNEWYLYQEFLFEKITPGTGRRYWKGNQTALIIATKSKVVEKGLLEKMQGL